MEQISICRWYFTAGLIFGIVLTILTAMAITALVNL